MLPWAPHSLICCIYALKVSKKHFKELSIGPRKNSEFPSLNLVSLPTITSKLFSCLVKPHHHSWQQKPKTWELNFISLMPHLHPWVSESSKFPEATRSIPLLPSLLPPLLIPATSTPLRLVQQLHAPSSSIFLPSARVIYLKHRLHLTLAYSEAPSGWSLHQE